MLSNNDPGHIKRIRQVSYKLNIPEEVIELALYHTSEYIKNKIASIDIDPDILMTEEEFREKMPIIKVPSLGYFNPNYLRYKIIHEKSKQKRERKLKEDNNE